MRRKTVRQLANAGRAVALVGCLLGVGVALVWRQAPELVAGFERDLLARHVAPVDADLAQVRVGDRLAQLAVDRRRSLAQAAERRGDAPAAIAIWRDAVAFDPLDAEAAAKLAELQTISGGPVAAAAFERLTGLLAMAPGSVPVVAANVRALARAGRIEAAMAVLEAATALPSSSVWSVRAAGVEGTFGPPMLAVADRSSSPRVLVRLPRDARRLRFEPEAPLLRSSRTILRMHTDGGAPMASATPAWTDDGALEFMLPDVPVRCVTAELVVDTDLKEPARTDIAWIALDPVIDRACRPHDTGRLRRCREQALAGTAFVVRVVEGSAEQGIGPTFASPCEFSERQATLAWRLPRPAAELRFELPSHAALHRWVRIVGEPFAPERIVASGGVVLHADGIEVTGSAPWLQVRLRDPRDHVVVELLP